MLIKNISSNIININEKMVYPYQTIEIDNLDKVKRLLNIGYIEVIESKDIELTKDNILEAFFNFHLRECSKEELDIIRSFYIKIFPNIDGDIKDQMKEASTEEELIEILLNSFYPMLIDKKLSESE